MENLQAFSMKQVICVQLYASRQANPLTERQLLKKLLESLKKGKINSPEDKSPSTSEGIGIGDALILRVLNRDAQSTTDTLNLRQVLAQSTW